VVLVLGGGKRKNHLHDLDCEADDGKGQQGTLEKIEHRRKKVRVCGGRGGLEEEDLTARLTEFPSKFRPKAVRRARKTPYRRKSRVISTPAKRLYFPK